MDEFKRLTTESSLQIIRDIADEIWPETFRDILSEDQIRYMMQMMYAPEVMAKEFADGYTFEVLFCNGKPAGYMVSSVCESDSDTLKLHKLYLLKQYHGTGRGQLMLDHVADAARNDGFRILRLNVNKQNQRAIKAYLRNGFEIAAAEKNDIGSGYFMDDYVMEKVL